MRPANSDIERAKSALMAIDPALPRDEWVKVMMAAKAAEIDFDFANTWSASASNYGGEASTRADWKSFHDDGAIGAGTLFMYAKKYGWQGQHSSVTTTAKPTAPRTTKKPPYAVNDVWALCIPVQQHTYIERKCGLIDNIRLYPMSAPPLKIARQDVRGFLAIPAYNLATGEIQTIQFVPDQGKKLNLTGLPVAGGFMVGAVTQTIYVVEGIGQAWTAHQATGNCAVVSFGSGRMKTIASELRQQYPQNDLVLVADVGQEIMCMEIANALNCNWVATPPEFGNNGDINDLQLKQGLAAVTQLLATPTAPVTTENDQKSVPLGFSDVRDGTETSHALTELGNADRMLDLYRSSLRYVPETEQWLIWDNHAWKKSPDGAKIRELTSKLPRTIYAEGNHYPPRDGEHFAKWARKSQERRTIDNVVDLFADMGPIRLAVNQLDSDIWKCRH